MGVTQLASSYVRDKSVFMGMLSMTEEETKKENTSKEEVDLYKFTRNTFSFSAPSLYQAGSGLYYIESKVRITHQFISENHTPPPDLKN